MSATASSTEASAKAAQLLADVWSDLERDLGKDKLVFPAVVLWLNGAPGAGKGTNTRTIMSITGITQKPVVVSDLLATPEFIKIKNSGALVGDREVIGLLLKKLLDPAFRAGVIVDGFPRSPVQAEFMRRLHGKMLELHRADAGTFPAVRFTMVVLNVAEDVAVERQLKRGREAVQANEQSRKVGSGQLEELRATDVDPAAAAKRFRVFQEQTVGALMSLKDIFTCHMIDAGADIPTVAAAIQQALK